MRWGLKFTQTLPCAAVRFLVMRGQGRRLPPGPHHWASLSPRRPAQVGLVAWRCQKAGRRKELPMMLAPPWLFCGERDVIL